MMTTRIMSGAETTDAELVGESLTGNRDAFGRIVTRYQSLICSLAYSATGCLGQSDDLAQETFITAWRHLRHLREPGKLRAWLCGIARNRINNSLRREGREPLRDAEPLDVVHDAPAPEPLPTDRAISKEEEAILWRSLERIPENYREPLVLFYREHQSVERVAEELELSEDAVKQRLSRGRKLLHEQVLAFVEGALERTNPGKAFTLGVLAALPVFATSASAATVGTAATKASAIAKVAVAPGFLGALLGSLGSIVGVLGGYVGTRASIINTRSPRERQFMIHVGRMVWGFVTAFLLLLFSAKFFGHGLASSHPAAFVVTIGGLWVAYLSGLIVFIVWGNSRQRQIQIQDGTYVQRTSAPTAIVSAPSRGAICGSLGGSIVGGTLWMAILAGHTHDWLSLGVVVLAAAGTFIAGTMVCLRRLDKCFAIAAASTAVIGVLAVILMNLRWENWFGHDLQFESWSARGMSVVIVLLYSALALLLLSRQQLGTKGKSEPRIPSRE